MRISNKNNKALILLNQIISMINRKLKTSISLYFSFLINEYEETHKSSPMTMAQQALKSEDIISTSHIIIIRNNKKKMSTQLQC